MNPLEQANQLRENLKKFSLYQPQHDVWTVEHTHGISCGYRTVRGIPIATTHFDIQLSKETAYLLSFEIATNIRGQGIGTELYSCVEDFCIAQACTRIELTASGMGKMFWPQQGFSPRFLNNESILEKSLL